MVVNLHERGGLDQTCEPWICSRTCYRLCYEARYIAVVKCLKMQHSINAECTNLQYGYNHWHQHIHRFLSE